MLRYASAEPTWTIEPRSRSRIRRSAAIVPQTVPRYVTSVARRYSSGVRSRNGANTVAIALLTHVSIGPSSSSTLDAAASTAAGSATSTVTGSARAPSACTSRAADSSRSRPRASRPTLTPSRAKRWTVALPTPADAPVMTATAGRKFIVVRYSLDGGRTNLHGFSRPATGKNGFVSEDLRLLDGTTIFSSGERGDIVEGEGDGYFHDDVRHLSEWCLLVDGKRPDLLASAPVHYYAGRVDAALTADEPRIAIRRDRFVTDGVHEDVSVTNLAREPRELRLELRFAADFADVLEAEGAGGDDQGRIPHESAGNEAILRYERDGYTRATVIRFGEACEGDGVGATFRRALDPREVWQTCIDIVPVVDGTEQPPLLDCASLNQEEPEQSIGLPEWIAETPRLEGGPDELRGTYRRSVRDLASLRVRGDAPDAPAFPAGGIPWYLALFGRDSLITSYAALPFQPRLAAGALEALAAHQATAYDDFRDAEPGKILHELRRGKLVALGVDPHGPYYGTHDATQLFLIVLDEYERWTGDAELVRQLEPAARAALGWIEGSGDLDGDGYLEYERRSPQGLQNHCWKDSDGSIVFADGRVALPPIATCELQGYAYDARRRLARLGREVYGDEALAARLEADAAALRERVNRDFWSNDAA